MPVVLQYHVLPRLKDNATPPDLLVSLLAFVKDVIPLRIGTAFGRFPCIFTVALYSFFFVCVLYRSQFMRNLSQPYLFGIRMRILLLHFKRGGARTCVRAVFNHCICLQVFFKLSDHRYNPYRQGFLYGWMDGWTKDIWIHMDG